MNSATLALTFEGQVKAEHDKIKDLACRKSKFRTGSWFNLKSHVHKMATMAFWVKSRLPQ